ncbi:VOC family protein [Halobacillus sp. HZG1]|uniref:VOC family protein n=1 Tax=Halobacillus sp. HZG1 TaxID=3111769 RepID=UPI002DBB1B29|nr:VOC family protein [Halobacillus sp. HZG1]MEC3885690.1 VOC family protein [Halobacillus sp. HZG1]
MSEGLLHHVEVYVSNLKRSEKFWGWFLEELGYKPYQQWVEGQSWKLGETYLVFVQTETEYLDIPYHRRRTGLNHFAFHASSRERVDEMTMMLKERGVNVLYENQHPFAGGEDYYAVYFEDPDRIKVEFVASSPS